MNKCIDCEHGPCYTHMTTNNWEEEVKSVPRYLGCNELELASEMNQILIKELTKKDKEHKAELEMIKREIVSSLGFSICSAHQTWNENCKLCGIAQIPKEEVVAILDSHINKLSTE